MSDQKTILVIDDEKDLTAAMSTALEDEGFKVLTADDGKEGLAQALEHKPDLILLDILMPEMDGHEVLKRIRADEWGKEAKVVVMTVLDDMDSVAEVLEDGARDYIVKTDIKLEKMVEKVKEVLGS